MREYLDQLSSVLDYGYTRGDRTGTGTISLFGPQYWVRMYSLGKGRTGCFPLLTTKKMFFRGVVAELLWFLSGSTDNRVLQKQGVHIWDAWATKEQTAKFGREENDLGPIYSKQWLSFGEWSKQVAEVPPRQPSTFSDTPTHPLAGKPQGAFDILPGDTHGADGRLYCQVRFQDTGYTYTIRRDQAERGAVKDPYAASVCGVGYLGEPSAPTLTASQIFNLKKTWVAMLARCYLPRCKEYTFYGAKGVRVCERWKCFADFLTDAQRLLGFYDKKDNLRGYQLDKDHYQATVYSRETCVWIPASMNKAYMHATPFRAVSPTGAVMHHFSTEAFAKAHDLNGHSIARVLRGERPTHKGWQFSPSEKKNLRFTSPRNQIAWVIEEIKRNPNSRRLLVSAWNPIEADQVELPPCHTLFQFYVRNGALDCKLYQRSGDAFLGVPFNLASYALLQCMVAHVTGLDVGRFIHSFGDLHIYRNHMEQVKEQLGRKPKDLPTLRLNPHVKDIFAFTLDDISLNGYDYHAPLKGAVAV